jgi:hypothetical protein
MSESALDSIWAVLLVALGGVVAFVVWLRSKVTAPPPSPILALTVSPSSVQEGGAVTFSGTLTQGGSPQANKTVNLSVTPPSGDGYVLTAITDASGAFSKGWTAPSSPSGTYSVAVAYAGASTVTKTFIATQPELGDYTREGSVSPPDPLINNLLNK